MKEYMLLFRNEKMEQTPSAEQMKIAMQQWQSWISGIAKEGKYGGTNRLLPEGKTLKPNNVITDGPYLEAKEMVGGYLVVKAATLDEAVKLAQSCPNLLYGGQVEVRAVMTIDNDPTSGTFLHEKN
jgi:hypothetical protein